MSKYIIEIEEKPLCVFDKDTQTYFPRLWRVKGFNSLVLDEEGLSRLEELNSDYINEHYGDLQDTAYKKGLHDGESKCGYCNEYQRGLDDAWEAARKVALNSNDDGLSIEELDEIFGCYTLQQVFRQYSAQQTINMIKAYEEKQKADDEIKVGDEVRHDRGWTAVVTSIDNVGFSVIDYNGEVASYSDISKFTKTGRHFDIPKILEEMRT